jgi:hypothetical protein
LSVIIQGNPYFVLELIKECGRQWKRESDAEAIVILEVVEKKTQQTPKATIETCQQRKQNYEEHKKRRKS